ncbi:MAG TPA: hypothetical protein PKK12_11040 [Candidatus Aminicenantes bacterium]|nr:hypothetical protein [Candidatus Aminicenantes bacterium]
MSIPHAGDAAGKTPSWLYIYLSLILTILTLFIFLFTYTEKDPAKVKLFRDNFKKALMIAGRGSQGQQSVVDRGGEDPLKALANRMRSEGMTVKLMEEFVSRQQIRDLAVKAGESGSAVVIPEAVRFGPASTAVPPGATAFLKELGRLLNEVPFVMEIRARASPALPATAADPLELSAQRALALYDFFLALGVDPLKLRAAGYGEGPDRAEFVFKSPEL